MRITSELLHKIARDTVAARSKADLDILAVYLHGSLLEEEPLLGGTADVDLFFVHNEEVVREREIVRMTDDVTLDISHHPRTLYRQARELRQHPWLGPTIYSCRILYDPQHFMDFTQASVRGQFNRPENVIARARSQADHARQIWLGFQDGSSAPTDETVQTYLRAIDHAANAVASFNGPPLPERRFLLRFLQRAEAIGKPGMYHGLIGLLGGPHAEPSQLREWLPFWKAAYTSVPASAVTPRLEPCRLPYYQRAFEAMLDSEHPQAILWPLLETWVEAVRLLPPDSPARAGWDQAGQRLGLLGEGFDEKITALDAFLDMVEETLDTWAAENGV